MILKIKMALFAPYYDTFMHPTTILKKIFNNLVQINKIKN